MSALSNIKLNVNDIKVLTPSGYQPFTGVQKIQRDNYWHIITESNKELRCSIKHPLYKENVGYTYASNIEWKDRIRTTNGFESVLYSEFVNEPIELYDLLDVGNGNELYTNNILSHNCEFLGSTHTLISAQVLQRLTTIRPLKKVDEIRYYKEREKGNVYVCVVDTSRGVGLDYSAFIVFDVSKVPYEVVCTYRNNMVSTLAYPKFIIDACTYYNNAFILVEVNDAGQQVLDILLQDLEYDGILTTMQKKKVTQASSGFGQNKTFNGVRTTKQVKRIGCSSLKAFVESDKLIINDYNLLQELFRFSLKGISYEAEQGNDDLVACCFLFSWLATQPYFRDLTSVDMRRHIYEENERMLEEDLVPFGIIDHGLTIQEEEEIHNDTDRDLRNLMNWF